VYIPGYFNDKKPLHDNFINDTVGKKKVIIKPVSGRKIRYPKKQQNKSSLGIAGVDLPVLEYKLKKVH